MAKKKKNTNTIDTINNFTSNVYTSDSYTINTSSSTTSISSGISTYTTIYIPNNDVEYWPTSYSSYYWSNPFEKKKKTVFLQEELDI